jgi:L,D-transpeptidase catalytic domain
MAHIFIRILGLLAFAFIGVQAANAKSNIQPVDGPIEQLKAGEYLWAPQIAPEGPVTMIISVNTQRGYVYRNGVPIGVTSVSTGKKGHETPTGIFTILQKDIDHRSSKYNNAPMPYMQRLTWDGVAIHAGNLPGYPASHGCVRMPYDFAKLLFGITKLGLTVVITDDPLVPEVVTAPAMFDQTDTEEKTNKEKYEWHPEKSLNGPLSIVVSGRDRKIIVLRNGIQIGESDIQIDGSISETLAFTLRGQDAAGFHWLRLPLPGQELDAANEMTQEERMRGHIPEQFRAALAAILTPGATLLVTRETLKSKGTGKRLTVMASDQDTGK